MSAPAKPEEKKPDGAPAAGAAAPAAGGGMKAMIPLIANIVLMPVLAFAMTKFILLPKLVQQVASSGHTEEGHAAEEGGHGGGGKNDGHGGKSDGKGQSGGDKGGDKGGHGGGDKGGGKNSKGKVTAPLSKPVLVNVMGTMGTRYLMGSYTLVGTAGNFEGRVKEADAQLRDLASGVMASKTVADLEKPGARNLIRAELMAVFNNILGQGFVQDIYITDFAIQ